MLETVDFDDGEEKSKNFGENIKLWILILTDNDHFNSIKYLAYFIGSNFVLTNERIKSKLAYY